MKLKEIREMYPEGTQIVLTEMAGESRTSKSIEICIFLCYTKSAEICSWLIPEQIRLQPQRIKLH